MAHNSKVVLKGGAEISQFGVGTATLGGLYSSMSDEDSQAVISSALELGITYFDTAPHYGKGASELRLGKLLAPYPRNSYVISTKVGRLLVANQSSDNDPDFADADSSVHRVFDFSGRGVEQSLQESLERLGLDKIDIAFIHDPDNHADQAIHEAYPALEKLRSQGVIKSIGVGMNQVAIPLRFVRETDIDVVLIAGRYTLLDQSAGRELLPEARNKGISIVAAGVLNSGILANPVAGTHYDYEPASTELISRAQELQKLFAQFGVSLTQAAFQFPLRNPAVTSVLIGCRSEKEVRDNVADFDKEIPDEAWNAFDSIIHSWKLKS